MVRACTAALEVAPALLPFRTEVHTCCSTGIVKLSRIGVTDPQHAGHTMGLERRIFGVGEPSFRQLDRAGGGIDRAFLSVVDNEGWGMFLGSRSRSVTSDRDDASIVI